MAMPRWLLLALIGAVIFGTIARADDDETGNAAPTPDADDEVEAPEEASTEEEADKDPNSVSGVIARAWFLGYDETDLKVPAGERVEVLVAFENAPANSEYKVAFIAAHLSPLNDHSRYVQNFSGQVYERAVQGGETATIKYSFTPDALVDPMDYSFVVKAFFMNDDNATYAATAYNGTITIADPLGFDFKSMFSVVSFFGAIGAVGYFFVNRRAASRPSRSRAATQSPTETGTRDLAYDPEFVSAEHVKYAERKSSKSPNKRSSSK